MRLAVWLRRRAYKSINSGCWRWYARACGFKPQSERKSRKSGKKQTAKERQKWEKEDKKTKAAEGASPRTDGKPRRHHPERSKKNLHSESHHIFANIKQLMLYPFFLLTSPCSRDFGFEKQYSKTKVNV